MAGACVACSGGGEGASGGDVSVTPGRPADGSSPQGGDGGASPGSDASASDPTGDGGAACDPRPVTVHEAVSVAPAATSSASELWDGHCGAATGQMFPPDAPWNQSVRRTCVDPDSDAVVEYLAAVVDGGQTFRIDMGEADEPWGFQLQAADDSVVHQPFTPTDDFFAVACDEASVPVPAGGRLEGEVDYQCSSDGDCHLLVYDTDECRLFEQWRADDVAAGYTGGCLAVWSTASVDPGLRGLGCTSADAAGLPIMPLLITPHEIAAGEIRHALRFILPNEAVQRDVYVRPATHNPLTESRFGPPNPAAGRPPPYGVRLRLRADFDATGLSTAAQVIVNALKEYGMFHADGGNVTFIASNANGSPNTWAEVGLGPNDLRDALQWTDFEVVSDLSDVVSMDAVGCDRTPLDEF